MNRACPLSPHPSTHTQRERHTIAVSRPSVQLRGGHVTSRIREGSVEEAASESGWCSAWPPVRKAILDKDVSSGMWGNLWRFKKRRVVW